MMRVAIILYVLAAILLTATVTHYLSREAFIQRTDKVIARVMNDPEIAKDPDDLVWMNRVTKMFRMSASGPCLMALELFAPFLSCLYGAMAIHRGISRGKPRKWYVIVIGMSVAWIVGMMLAAASVPC